MPVQDTCGSVNDTNQDKVPDVPKTPINRDTTVPPLPPAPTEPSPPPPAPVKVDYQADAFAKFFKRVGTPVVLEQEKVMQERSLSPAPVSEEGGDEPLEEAESPTAQEPLAKESQSDQEQPGLPSKDSVQEPVWPRRSPDRAKSEDPQTSPSTPKATFALPPPGTVTKKASPDEVGTEVAAADDDMERIQEVSPLDHRFVGLVIGKAGDTIKTFKKQSGASIEIDQKLPDGMPRVVIYRGTRKQVSAAKKLVDGLVQRAKEDEKTKTSGVPIGAGMGIMGRGESKDNKDVVEKARLDDVARSDLPPWRRGKPGEDEQRSQGAEGARRTTAGRRDAPWAKREKECEAAPSGSLTGAISLSGDAKLSMRPAWMKPKGSADAPEDPSSMSPVMGPFDRSLWQEQKYSRSFLVQAKQTVLKMKADEVPEEMVTMAIGARPKWKPERHEKEGKADDMNLKEDEPQCESPRLILEKAASDNNEEEAPTRKEKLSNSSIAVGPYENLPGDSKDIMKLKKKLREIQKIEDSIKRGETVEPNQEEKVTKKVGYLDELRLLESIVRSPVTGSGGV